MDEDGGDVKESEVARSRQGGVAVWANALNRSVAAFAEAQKLLEGEDSIAGKVVFDRFQFSNSRSLRRMHVYWCAA